MKVKKTPHKYAYQIKLTKNGEFKQKRGSKVRRRIYNLVKKKKSNFTLIYG